MHHSNKLADCSLQVRTSVFGASLCIAWALSEVGRVSIPVLHVSYLRFGRCHLPVRFAPSRSTWFEIFAGFWRQHEERKNGFFKLLGILLDEDLALCKSGFDWLSAKTLKVGLRGRRTCLCRLRSHVVLSFKLGRSLNLPIECDTQIPPYSHSKDL
jgi:hypothetical protein